MANSSEKCTKPNPSTCPFSKASTLLTRDVRAISVMISYLLLQSGIPDCFEMFGQW